MTTAIKIENLSKQYRLGVIGTGTLSHDLNRWWTMNVLRKDDPYLKIGETNDRATKGNSDYVWALRDGQNVEHFDIFKGYIVNNKLFDTINLYFSRLMSKDDALREPTFAEPNWQICITTQATLDKCLKFTKS